MSKKKTWARIGITVELTEDELYEIMKRSMELHRNRYWSEGFENLYLDEETAKKYLAQGAVDGDSYSYIPGGGLKQHWKWFREERIKREKHA